MSYVIFAVAELIGALLLAAYAKGIIGMIPAFLSMVGMLTLSFHVMARRDRPDGTSIRMASFAAVLWYACILGGKLALEPRGWAVHAAAGLFTAFCAVLSAFAAWSVTIRPLELDVEED